MYELGATVVPHTGLHEAAVPVLANLRHSTGETVQLAVLDHLEVVIHRTVRRVRRRCNSWPVSASDAGPRVEYR